MYINSCNSCLSLNCEILSNNTISKLSRLTGSESQGQEAAACMHPAYATTSVLFTGTNAVKFPSAVTWSTWALPLSYFRANTFLPCKISNLR